jgi:gliding motility-associated-like protein
MLVLGEKVSGQDFSNKGKEFFITFPAHVDGTQAVMGIYITSDVAATGQVTIGNGGPVININITANNVQRIFLGNTTASDAPNGAIYQDQVEGIKPGSAIRVTTDQPVVVYSHIIRSARSGSTLVLPTPTWGREYVVPSYSSNSSNGAIGGRGVINVVAKDTNTLIEITPRANSANGVRQNGTPYTITLANPGDVYQIQFSNLADISGTLVKSISSGTVACKPIGVFSATTWSAFNCPGASGGDNLYQQLFPTRSFGKTFITAPFANRQRDIIRIFTVEPNTTISKTEAGATVNLTVNANGYAEFETNLPTSINADKPIQVVQYMNAQSCDTRNPQGCAGQGGNNTGNCPFPADPEMVILNPIEQTINNITVFSAHRNSVPPGQSNVVQCYLNIIIPTAAATSFRINGTPPTGNFQAIPGTGFSYLQENVSAISAINPVQQLTADSSYSCIAYGYGNVESYGYNAGTNVKDLSQFLTVRDPYQSVDAASACPQVPSKLFVTLPFPATRIEWRFYGLFPDVVIENPAPDSTFQRDGKTLYRFPLTANYTFTTPGSNKVSVFTTNPTSDGCTGEQQLDFEIVVRAKPTADFTINYSSCIVDSARFTSTATIGAGSTINRWDWEFGDGRTQTGNPVANRYLTPGNFQVRHRVQSSFGCVSDTVQKQVVANPRPVAAFTLAGPFCQNRLINMTNTSSSAAGTINRWYWIMGNGQVFDRNSGAPFTYAYPATGTYTVKLVVTTDGGCASDTVQQIITVGTIPVPGFTLPEVCLNDAFAAFTNTSTISDGTLNQVTWLWNYNNPNATPGNPNTSTQLNGRHRYASAATFPVKLVATSNLGCADSITQNLTVNGDNPQPNFDIVTKGSICSNLPVQIRNKSTVNFGTISRVIVYWNFGTNNNDTTQDESPVFDKVYTKKYTEFSSPSVRQVQIRLRAFSGEVCVNDLTKTIDLYATPDPRITTIPSICLDANPRQITQGFDAGNNPGQGIYTGSGFTNPNGLFDPKIPGAGTHAIQYKYRTAAGCTDSTNGNIRVWPSPTSNFDISNPTCISAPITFSNTSVANANAIVTWNWNYGDGVTETRNNGTPFTRTYTTAQNYSVTLRVTTDSGCVSIQTTKTLSVYPAPNADFDLPTTPVCLPLGRAQFTNRTTVGGTGGTPLAYTWSFGPAGATSTQTNPIYNYNAVGPYNVELIATSARGCVDTIVKVINNIIAQPMANWIAAPNAVCLGDAIQFTDQSNPLNNTITAWNWNFDDGSISVQQSPQKTYSRAGTFRVSMFYSTAIGCNSDTVIKQVIVHPYPVVDAGPDQVVLSGGQVVLRATVSGSSNYQYLWTPPTGLDNPAILQPSSSPDDDILYTLTVTGEGGCSASDEVFVRRLLKPEIPNAFTPNGDGINDLWIIKYLDTYPGATVRVFDRYGKSILESTGYPRPWDGTIGGKPIPSGTYYYIVDPKNSLKPITGSVTIIR